MEALYGVAVAFVGAFYHLYSKRGEETARALSKRQDENTKALQENTRSNSHLAQGVQVLGEKLEGFKRESTIEMNAVREKLKEHEVRHSEHDKEFKHVRDRLHEVGNASHQALGLAQLNVMEFQENSKRVIRVDSPRAGK